MNDNRTYPDFSSELTVFISTVGSETFNDCLRCLESQDCRFRLKIIDRVAPMSAAFQQMMDQCETPFFVQVDEDMLLYSHAVRTLYEHFHRSDQLVAQIVYGLYDVHLEEVIYGLKIYRHDIVRGYPFNDVDGCEWDQIRRFRNDGFIDIRMPIENANRASDVTLGLHGTYWTPNSAYIRFAMLERRRRKGNKTNAHNVHTAKFLVERFMENKSEVDFYALMGFFAGALSVRLGTDHERDYRRYPDTPGFRHIESFVYEVRHAWSDGEYVDPQEAAIGVMEPKR